MSLSNNFDYSFNYSSFFDYFLKHRIDKLVWNGFFWEFYFLNEGKWIFSHSAPTILDGLCLENIKTKFSLYTDEQSWEDTSKHNDNIEDFQRIIFLEYKLFNLIVFDPITNQWCIGDKDTNIFAAYDFDLRGCIDRLINK